MFENLYRKNVNNENTNKYKPDMNKSMFSDASEREDKAPQRSKYDIGSDDDEKEAVKASPKQKRKDSVNDSDNQSDSKKNSAGKKKRKDSDEGSRKSSNSRSKSRS